MTQELLVRIKPNLPRETHVFGGLTIRKAKGWHTVPAGVGQAMRSEPLSDTDPASPLLFDVMTEEQAREIVTREAHRADPSGTPDVPIRPIAMAPPPSAAPPLRPARGGKQPR
jgi:hypothetical protein